MSDENRRHHVATAAGPCAALEGTSKTSARDVGRTVLSEARRIGWPASLFVLLGLVVSGIFFDRAVRDAFRREERMARREIARLHLSVLVHQAARGTLPQSLDEAYRCDIAAPGLAAASLWIPGCRAPLDPWGHRYSLVVPGGKSGMGFDVISAGRDGAFGTDDDLGNWDERVAR